jgi:predicted RNase H-like HicB family nuclease
LQSISWEADREAHESRISEKMLAEVPLPRLSFDTMRIEVQCEEDQRWIAEVLDLPGVMAYGDTRDQAVARAESLALRVIADRIDHGESIPELDDLFVVSA